MTTLGKNALALQSIPRPESLAPLVMSVRGEKVLLDADLAELYGVATKALNQAVKRNLDRFPSDFMFQLTSDEWSRMRSQTVTASRRNISALPYAFTEQGVAMLSSVLRSQRAVEVNIAIMRTFVQLRRLMDSNRDLARRIEAMETRYDEQFSAVFDAIKQLISDDQKRKGKRPIGFL
jgi:ORF6N domain